VAILDREIRGSGMKVVVEILEVSGVFEVVIEDDEQLAPCLGYPV
jgi:hypothetical protein